MPSTPVRHLPSSPFNVRREAAVRQTQIFQVGDRVTHDSHGLGRVTGFDGAAVYVDFGHGGRRLPLPTSKLHMI